MSMNETTTEPTKQKVAKHELIDARGEIVDSEEAATGIRYTQLATGEKFEYQTGGEVGKTATMLAIFGAKTLATNEASQVRNNPKGGGDDGEQMESIRERFALIDSGKWIDRTREGVGAAVDKDKLASAVVEVAKAAGKITAETEGDTYAKVRAKLEEDKGYQRVVRQVPGVNEAYARLVGRPTKSVDDLLLGV